MTIAESRIQMQRKSRARRERLRDEFFAKQKFAFPDGQMAKKCFEMYLEGYARGVQESEMDAEGADIGFYEEDFY